MNQVSSYAAGGRQAGAADENTQVAEAGEGGHQEGKLTMGLRRVWGWEEERDGDLHSACHVFWTPYSQPLTQGKV